MPLPPAFVDDLALAVGEAFVITEPERLATYDCDGLTGWRARPACVVLPGSTDEVQAVLRLCARDGVPFVARGAGTGLSGGALPVADGVVVSLARMNRILEVDVESERVVVEPGVTNLDVTRAVAPYGYFYAPDPSSQQVCTIGGNVAENSGGAHCLKHGFTVNHVTGAKVVLPDGELLELGGQGDRRRRRARPARRDRRLRGDARDRRRGDAPNRSAARGGRHAARGVHDGRRRGGRGLADRRGGDPARRRWRSWTASRSRRPRRPTGRATRRARGRSSSSSSTASPCRSRRTPRPWTTICRAAGAFEIRTARDAAERALLWLGRKGAFAAMGRVSPDYYVQDGVVPRTKLPGGAAPHRRAVRGARPPGRERLPRGRRQPPSRSSSTTPPWRVEYERAKALADADPRRVRRGRRLAHGRARDRRRQGVRDAVDVLRARPRGLRARPPRVRPGRPREPRQGDPHAAPLRRGARPVPRPPARAARPRGAILMRPVTIEEASALLAGASADGAPGQDRRATSRRTGSTGSSSTRPATSPARSRRVSASRRSRAALAGARPAPLARPARRPDGRRLPRRRLSGPLSHRFGTPRDLVLGVTLVLGDGTIASSGGKVVKNVAGYDLGKLVCGSEGRLALIARVALRLHPLPAASATLVVETADPAGVVRELRRSQLQPSALDVLHPGRVAVLFEGRERAVAAQLDAARALVGGEPARTSRSGSEAPRAPGALARSRPLRAPRPRQRRSRRWTRPSSGRPPASPTCRTVSAACPAPPRVGSSAR